MRHIHGKTNFHWTQFLLALQVVLYPHSPKDQDKVHRSVGHLFACGGGCLLQNIHTVSSARHLTTKCQMIFLLHQPHHHNGHESRATSFLSWREFSLHKKPHFQRRHKQQEQKSCPVSPRSQKCPGKPHGQSRDPLQGSPRFLDRWEDRTLAILLYRDVQPRS